MGTPVIATNHGGIVDVVRPGITGFLFDVGEVSELSEQICTASTETMSGLRKSVEEDFSLNSMVERTCLVYRQLLGR